MSGPWDHRLPGGGWAELSPISFLLRSARVFPGRTAVQAAGDTLSYSQLLDRVNALAGGLAQLGVSAGDRVAVLLPNTPEMLEAHFAVPGMGAVLVPMNTRLVASELAYILEHSGATCLIAPDTANDVVESALEQTGQAIKLLTTGPDGSYESLLADATPGQIAPQPETSLLSINYTSGTTGKPKGVMYTHRGAFLQTVGVIGECGLSTTTRYLWTLPMFHCHGWAFTWGVTAVGGLHVCLPKVDAADSWRALVEFQITHLCGAPTVLGMLLDAEQAQPSENGVRVYTGGSPPSPTVIERCESLGWEVTHLYGLTETYGPMGVCVWHPEWNELPPERRAQLKARQGVESFISQPIRVVDEQMRDVPADGETLGEIVMRGNNVTIGYYRDEAGTATALASGFFHSGDVGVMHPDGYVEIRDRAKDVIISGGENVSSIEVEQALCAHPAVAEAAVVSAPHPKWGETPHAFVILRPGEQLDPADLREFTRGQLAAYKMPSRVSVLDSLPTTATGKVQKFRLRELAAQAADA